MSSQSRLAAAAVVRPNTAPAADRYADRPFLRLLELYVLWAIEELPEQHRKIAESIAPALGQAMGSTGDWQQIVAQAMSFPIETPYVIREQWLQARRRAEARSETFSPQGFAEQFVDTLFADGAAGG